MFGEAAFQLAWGNPPLMGAIAAVIIPLWLAFLLRPRRSSVRSLREKVADRVGAARAGDVDRMLNWLPPDAGDARRRSIRRGGPPTAIRVARAPTADPEGTAEGLVLDRSEGGLCVAVERPVRAGDMVYLRAAPDSSWVGVVVRHCRDCGGYFLLGCQYPDGLPLADRLQFG